MSLTKIVKNSLMGALSLVAVATSGCGYSASTEKDLVPLRTEFAGKCEERNNGPIGQFALLDITEERDRVIRAHGYTPNSEWTCQKGNKYGPVSEYSAVFQ